VILLATNTDSSFIYDFDSTLPVPLTAIEYLDQTFEKCDSLRTVDLPFFKSIDAADYLASFNSDRSHMKDDAGKWLSDPPKWQIIGKNGDLPLPELLDFTISSKQKMYGLDEIRSISYI
jgi:hypothetical protein